MTLSPSKDGERVWARLGAVGAEEVGEPRGFCLAFSPVAESLNQIPHLLSRFPPRVKGI